MTMNYEKRQESKAQVLVSDATVEELVVALHGRLESMSYDQRRGVIDDVVEGYCRHCGGKLPSDNTPCYCAAGYDFSE